MLAQQQQPQQQPDVKKKPSTTPYSDSTNYFFIDKPTACWLEATDVLTDKFISNTATTFENKADSVFHEGKVFLQASGGAASPSFNIKGDNSNPFNNDTTATQYQKYKVITSDQSFQDGKIYWCRTSDVTRSVPGYQKNQGTQLGENSLIDGDLLDGNLIAHEFRSDVNFKGSTRDANNAFTFGLSGTDNTSSYQWLQFVWREIYGTKDNGEKFLNRNVTTTGGTYALTQNHDPKTNNINTDSDSSTEPWYSGTTLRTPKTFTIIDRPAPLAGVISNVPDDWSEVHSKFHGITYLVRDDFFSIHPLHEYKFEVDWDMSRYFPIQNLLDTPTTDEIDNIVPTTRMNSSTKTSKIDTEAKKTLKRQFPMQEANLDES